MKYLETIQPTGRTQVIPALERAFAVLKQLPNNKRGRLLFLLTDGGVQRRQREGDGVAEANNPPGPDRVHINAILHLHQSPAAMKVLRDIAEANGGKFRFVEGTTGPRSGQGGPAGWVAAVDLRYPSRAGLVAKGGGRLWRELNFDPQTIPLIHSGLSVADAEGILGKAEGDPV